jgi:hypothetical protein
VRGDERVGHVEVDDRVVTAVGRQLHCTGARAPRSW